MSSWLQLWARPLSHRFHVSQFLNLLRFMSLTIFQSIRTPFTFKWPRWQRQSSSLPSPIRDYVELATSALCTFIENYFVHNTFAWCNCNGFTVARFYNIFVYVELDLQTLVTNLFTESKLVYNLDTWNAYLI